MRRAKPEKREILPDSRFNSISVQTMVQHVLKSGKKSTAVRLIYDAMDLIKERTEKNPIECPVSLFVATIRIQRSTASAFPDCCRSRR